MNIETARAVAAKKLGEVARQSDVSDLVLLDDRVQEHPSGFCFSTTLRLTSIAAISVTRWPETVLCWFCIRGKWFPFRPISP